MIKLDEHKEKELRAGRLRKARVKAGHGGPRKLHQKFGWKENTYKAHESGRNGFGITDARAYAKAFNVSLPWLYFNIGTMDDPYVETTDLINEVSEIFSALPASVQESQLASLRELVRAFQSAAQESDAD